MATPPPYPRSSLPSAYGAALGAVATSIFVLVVGVQFGPSTSSPPTTIFEAHTVLGVEHTTSCLTFAGKLNCLGFNLTIPGPAGVARTIEVRASLNRSCPTDCYVQLVSRVPGPLPMMLRVSLDPSGAASGVLPTGPAYLLLVETWGCSAFQPCPPASVTVTTTVTDLGPAP